MDPGSTLTISPVLLSLLRFGGLCEGSLLSSFKACSKSFLFKILAAFSVSVYPGGADKSCLILVTSVPSSFCVSVPKRRGLGDLPRALHGSCTGPSSGLGSADLDRLLDLGHFWKVSWKMGLWSMMLNKLERPSLMVVWTGLSLVVVDLAQADSLNPFWGVPGKVLLFGWSDLGRIFLCSFGEPYLGEQHVRSNLAWTFSMTGVTCLLLRLLDGEETGVEPPFGVRHLCGLLVILRRVSVCKPTLMVWVVCVPVVLIPLVWHAVSLNWGSPELELERIAFRTEKATSFISSLMFLDISKLCKGEAKPTVVQIGRSMGWRPFSRKSLWCLVRSQDHLPNISEEGPFVSATFPIALVIENRKSGSTWFFPSLPAITELSNLRTTGGLWKIRTPIFSVTPWLLMGCFWQCSGLVMVLVVIVTLVVRYHDEAWKGSGAGSFPAFPDSVLSIHPSAGFSVAPPWFLVLL